LMGCSSPRHVARLLHEGVNASACVNGTQSYCWHSCFNYTDYDASPDLCASRNLKFGCTDENGVLWADTHEPQYVLRCVETLIPNNATSNVTDDHHDDGHDDHSNTTGSGGGTSNGGGKSSASIKVLSGHAVALAVGAVTFLVASWM
jgi:hypothetical protein